MVYRSALKTFDYGFSISVFASLGGVFAKLARLNASFDKISNHLGFLMVKLDMGLCSRFLSLPRGSPKSITRER